MAIPDTLRERGAVLLKDPLSDVARRERRALLAVATVGYVIVTTGLVPSKIEALGITFSTKEQSALLTVFALVLIYFIVTFTLYAATDALAWAWDIYLAKKQLGEEVEAELTERRRRHGEGRPPDPPPVFQERFGYRYTIPRLALVRGVWDFLVPVVIGIVVVVLILRTAWK